jgi:upstream activation factor subunit UAF30
MAEKKKGGLTAPMKLSAELADIVGQPEASRAQCIKHLWAYIKKHNLQDPENKQYFNPDKKMAKVFGTDKLRGFAMSKHIGSHLTKLE